MMDLKTKVIYIALVLALVATVFNTAYSNFTAEDIALEHQHDRVLTLATDKFTVTTPGIFKQAQTLAAAGDSSGTSVEMVVSPYGLIRTALTKGNYVYIVSITENAVNSVTSGNFKAELLMDTGTGVPSSKGILYFKQGTADPSNVEGVLARWDLGASAPTQDTAFTTVVSVAT